MPIVPGSSDSIEGYRPFQALHDEVLPPRSPLRDAITTAYRRDEREAVRHLHDQLSVNPPSQQNARVLAGMLVDTLRAKRSRASGIDALMHEYALSSDEGIALMCLAEALLRIPDHQTADRLIADKISKADWHRHIGESPSLFVNAATWGLLITGKLVGTHSEHGFVSHLTNLIARGGEPLIRKSVDLAMRMLGNQFVTGQTIEAALLNSRQQELRGYTYSYDMLGEAALTKHDASKYYSAYETAIHAIGRASNGNGIKNGPGISVKLSALHPRYARAQRGRVFAELLPLLRNLFLLAKKYDIGLNIDAEEADRLELSLDMLEALAFDPALSGFDGLGFVVQAYQKRAPFVIDYLADLAFRSGHKLMIRLVKGAYWDTEIKRAQVDGLPDYPVYTRKVYTDLSYLVCSQKLLDASARIYPQFATHNALSVATIYTWAQERAITDYEFQCLHGMGETLYDQLVGTEYLNQRCRIYAPVGSHKTLLAYLVRRLLENGANSSFVNQVIDEKMSIDELLADPIAASVDLAGAPHPQTPLPTNLFGDTRKNSLGFDLSNEDLLRQLDKELDVFRGRTWSAHSISELSSSHTPSNSPRPILNPAHQRDVVGNVIEADASDVDHALLSASAFLLTWQRTTRADRASILLSAADLFESHRFELMSLLVRESGKSLSNAIGEVREAVDFLRYYAAQLGDMPDSFGLGIVACISPWNFPLSIFTGQVSAALTAGNVVLAKPAEQTPLIAYRAVQLLHQAGIPPAALHFLPGVGEVVGARIVEDDRVHGVVFTGSVDVAHHINRSLAKRAKNSTDELVLVAETGGQNTLIVDSSALPEQVVQDVIASAFDSAGQRCSALRVLCLQEDIAEDIIAMLKGAMRELSVGNPDRLATDVGPVIDWNAKRDLESYVDGVNEKARDFFQFPFSEAHHHAHQFGIFFAPVLFEIFSLSELKGEVFGPVLHILRFKRENLSELIDAINAMAFGLTLGVHSRIDETIDFITARARVGNIYVNRNIIGAVVGVQPFGGENKSGTGPKAGGPLYLRRLQQPSSTEFQIHSLGNIERKNQFENSHRSEFADFFSWLAATRHSKIYTLAQRYCDITLLGTRLFLAGPTGEQNTLSFVARESILCIAVSLPVLLNQIAASFAAGSQPTLTSECASLLPSDFPIQVRRKFKIIERIDLMNEGVQIALVEASLVSAVRVLLADSTAAVVSVIGVDDNFEIPMWRLVSERTLSINTTAAGGNVHLLSQMS